MVAAAASTNTPSLAMSPSQLAELVENDMLLSPEEKVACVQQYTKAMAAPICSCASCGVRTATEMPGAALAERGLDPGVGHEGGAEEDAEEDASELGADDATGDGDVNNADAGAWAHLEVAPAYLQEAHPSVPSMTGYDVCLLSGAYPDYPIGDSAVGWRAKVLRQRKVRVAGRVQTQVKLFGHWHDLEGDDVKPIRQLRDAAPQTSTTHARARQAEYTWYRLDELSFLRLTAAEQATWRAASERLRDFPLLGPMGTVERTVDLSRVCSVYEAPGGGEYYWLHPDLVDVRGPEPACLLCRKCASALLQGVRPAMNVANVDYGNLARVPELGTLSVLEELLLSPNRLYHVVVKVRPCPPSPLPPSPPLLSAAARPPPTFSPTDPTSPGGAGRPA